MFEELFAGPQPWVYGHVYLPGGTTNLANPTYALPSPSAPGGAPPPPSSAPLEGTLMRVVSFTRLTDARLRIVVQGLGRCTVLKGTRALPYARADVQLLPDSEALLAAARLNRRWLVGAQTADGSPEGTSAANDHAQNTSDPLDGDARSAAASVTAPTPAQLWNLAVAGSPLRLRMIAAAAAAEDACWREYDNQHCELDKVPAGELPPSYCGFEPAAAEAAAAAAPAAMLDAMRRVAMPPTEAPDPLYEGGGAVLSALMEAAVMAPLEEATWLDHEDEAAVAAQLAEEAVDAAEEAAVLEAIELQASF